MNDESTSFSFREDQEKKSIQVTLCSRSVSLDVLVPCMLCQLEGGGEVGDDQVMKSEQKLEKNQKNFLGSGF